MGSYNLGWAGQALYVVLTVADIVLTVVSLGGLAAIKAAVRVAFSAARRLVTAASRRIAAAWARRAAARQLAVTAGRRAVAHAISWKGAATKAVSALRQWAFFWERLGGVTTGPWSKFYAFARTTITNHDWAAGRLISGVEVWAHESVHWLGSRLPFNWIAQRVRPLGQPVGAVLNWAEETVAYAVGHTAVLRPHGVLAAPIEAFRSVYANFGGGAAGRQAVLWAAGELAVIGGGIAAVFGLRDESPEPQPLPAGAAP
jgi:hypothetical protein